MRIHKYTWMCIPIVFMVTALVFIYEICFGTGGLGLLGGASQGVVTGEACPSGTYEAGYDGDHSSGVDYSCYESGSTNEQATGNTADSVSSSYVQFDAADEYLEYTISGDISADLDSLGTWFFSWRKVDGGDTTFDSGCPGELVYNVNECLYCIFNSTLTRLICYHKGGATASSVLVTGLSTDTDYRCGYSWNAASDIHCLRCITSGSVDLSSPDDEDSETIDGFDDSGPVDPVTFAIGEHTSAQTFGGDDDVRVWDVYFVAGYKATDPGNL